MSEPLDAAPEWFRQVVAFPCQDRTIEVDGATIRYRVWGEEGKPGLVFAHGGGGHLHWWDFIAPYFTADYSVIALDFAGMGDSDRRDAYDSVSFATELVAVCDDAGFDRRAIAIGHSFGGAVSLKAATLWPERFQGIVMMDSAVKPPKNVDFSDDRRGPIRAIKMYPDQQSILSRFRLLPRQPCENRYLLDFIGRHSIMETAAGWRWKFDDTVFSNMDITDRSEDLASLETRLSVIYGEHSKIMPPEMVEYMRQALDDDVPFIEIPHAHHHLILDQPLACIAALRTLLAEWRHSAPQRGRVAGGAGYRTMRPAG